VCEVVQPAIDRRNATLMCRMTYEWQGRALQYNQPPVFDVSLSWTGVSGTTVSTTADPATFNGTVETNMTVESAVLTTVSSYRCTITFNFSPAVSFWSQYAVNPVSYTCQPTSLLGKCHFTNTRKQRKINIHLVKSSTQQPYLLVGVHLILTGHYFDHSILSSLLIFSQTL